MKCTCNLNCNKKYPIFDMFYYNVKWSKLDGKDLGWSPRRPRFKL